MVVWYKLLTYFFILGIRKVCLCTQKEISSLQSVIAHAGLEDVLGSILTIQCKSVLELVSRIENC